MSLKNDMKYQHAIRRLKKNYEKAIQEDYIRKPMAYALYQTWKHYDRSEVEKDEGRRDAPGDD